MRSLSSLIFTLSILFNIFAFTMRYIIKLSYCGAGFHGWQAQSHDSSVQGTVEKALSTLTKSEIPVTGAGRTDTGVNAFDYVAHFDAVNGLDTGQLCYKLNAILPHSIVVKSIVPADDQFHARFSATERKYTYFLHRVKNPFLGDFSYLYDYPDVDFDAMNRAAGALIGRHDFRCFEKTGTDAKTSICTVTEASWHRYTPSHIALMDGETEGYWYFRIGADRFLRNMVRAIVGTLLEVGRGKRSLDGFAALVLDCDSPSDESLGR